MTLDSTDDKKNLIAWTWLFLIQRCTACNFTAVGGNKTSLFLQLLWTVNIRNNAADGRKSTTECLFTPFWHHRNCWWPSIFVGCLFCSQSRTRLPATSSPHRWRHEELAERDGGREEPPVIMVSPQRIYWPEQHSNNSTTLSLPCVSNVAGRVTRSFVFTLSPLLRSAVG